MLQSVVSVSGQEQNMTYAPYIFQAHFNTVSSLLISKLIDEYPSNPQVLDMLEPFVKVVKIPVQDGFIDLQKYKEYRNILGAPFINLAPDGKPCGDNEAKPPAPLNANTFRTANLKAGCNVTPIVIVPQSEFAYLTSSKYAFPTHKKPIGYFADKFKIQVCPYDLPTATVLYVIQEPTYIYGYITQPDDTYIFNIATSVESDWTSAAFSPFFNAMVALYSAYMSNPELTNFAQVLHERGIL